MGRKPDTLVGKIAWPLLGHISAIDDMMIGQWPLLIINVYNLMINSSKMSTHIVSQPLYDFW